MDRRARGSIRVFRAAVEGQAMMTDSMTPSAPDAARVAWKSPLHEMTQTMPTCLWNDSASTAELRFALDHGAVGATCNPVIAHTVIKSEIATWRPKIHGLASRMPFATEDEIAWASVEQLSTEAAALLRDVFDQHKGRNGRLSIQTDPRLFRDPQRILEQARRFAALAPNMIVKIPATGAGIQAIEEATAEGISINATVSFTLSQAVAVAEAVERGLSRRTAAGQPVDSMGPVCTLMVGRLDDWLKVVMEKEGIITDPGNLEWAGVAIFKRAYALYRQRGYRLRLLSAAFRNHLHWSELLGGDVVISPPHVWQKRFVASDIAIHPRIDTPVAAHIVDDLQRRFIDFRRAYDEGGLAIEEFDGFAPTRRTLRQFLAACGDLSQLIRDVIVSNPD
jgi:transaldolase